jgi:hypothetical protein
MIHEILNKSKNIFIVDISEPEENAFEFTMIIGKVLPAGKFGENNGSEYGQIVYDEDCEKYKIYFDTYIAYSVVNESYDYDNGNEKFEGEKIRIYSKSNFLEYVKNDTCASEDYPGEFKHYAFISLNHIINVAAEEGPKITKLD